jgi:hypothetical protein
VSKVPCRANLKAKTGYSGDKKALIFDKNGNLGQKTSFSRLKTLKNGSKLSKITIFLTLNSIILLFSSV